MELQEWFITHPWAYYLYWILGIIFLIIIYKLPDVERDGKKMIVRLPHSLSGSVESEQGLKPKSKENKSHDQSRAQVFNGWNDTSNRIKEWND